MRDFASCGDRVKFVAAADVKPKILSANKDPGTRIDELREAVELYQFEKYDDYNTLLANHEIDIALVCAENTYHPVVAETLLRREFM